MEVHALSNFEVGIFELVLFGISLLNKLESSDSEFRMSLGLSFICFSAGLEEVCSPAQLLLLLLLRNNGDKLEDDEDIFS